MAVLIRQISSSSGRRRVCSAKCYNAKGSKCQCICDGRNHGIGLDKAIKVTGELAKELTDRGFEPTSQTYFPVGQIVPEKPNLLYKLRNLFRF